MSWDDDDGDVVEAVLSSKPVTNDDDDGPAPSWDDEDLPPPTPAAPVNTGPKTVKSTKLTKEKIAKKEAAEAEKRKAAAAAAAALARAADSIPLSERARLAKEAELKSNDDCIDSLFGDDMPAPKIVAADQKKQPVATVTVVEAIEIPGDSIRNASLDSLGDWKEFAENISKRIVTKPDSAKMLAFLTILVQKGTASMKLEDVTTLKSTVLSVFNTKAKAVQNKKKSKFGTKVKMEATDMGSYGGSSDFNDYDDM